MLQFKILELSAMFITMTTYRNVGNLKQMWDIFTATELPRYLARYARFNQQHPKATIVASCILRKATISSTEPVKVLGCVLICLVLPFDSWVN